MVNTWLTTDLPPFQGCCHVSHSNSVSPPILADDMRDRHNKFQ